MNNTKRCTKCGIEYPTTSEYFYKDNTRKDGWCCSCRNCHKEYRIKNKNRISQQKKEYRIKHEEHIKQYMKKYYTNHTDQLKEYRIKNREHILRQAKEYTQRNKEHILQERKEYYIKNKEKIAQRKHEFHLKNKDQDLERCRAYYRKNKKSIYERKKEYLIKNFEYISKRRRDYYATHKDLFSQYYKDYIETERGKMIRSCCSEKRRSAKKLLPATLTVAQWAYIKEFFCNKCAYCGKEKFLQQDHFIALSKGGEYSYGNIIPACASCNISKGDKSFFNWYPRHKFYSKAREKKILKFLNYHEQNQQLKLFI